MAEPSNQDEQQVRREKLEARNREMMRLAFEVFQENEKGARYLALLKKHFIEETPVFDPNKDSSWMYFREGQNHLIRMIEHQVSDHIRLSKQQAKSESAE